MYNFRHVALFCLAAIGSLNMSSAIAGDTGACPANMDAYDCSLIGGPSCPPDTPMTHKCVADFSYKIHKQKYQTHKESAKNHSQTK